jgi:hypothetical protein
VLVQAVQLSEADEFICATEAGDEALLDLAADARAFGEVEVAVGASITDTTLLSEEHGKSGSQSRTDCPRDCVQLRRMAAHTWSLQPSRNSREITPVQARAGPDPLRKLSKMGQS